MSIQMQFPLPDAQILKELKEKFKDSATVRSFNATILTVLPKSLNTWKVQEVFPSASNMIRRAKQLDVDQGVISSPDSKAG